MKLGPFLIGAISAQSGDDADRWDNTDFSLTDNIFTYEQPQEEKFDSSIGCTTTLVIQAVTCWESNHMGNLDHYVTTNDDGFGWKNIHHGHDQGGHSATKVASYDGMEQGTQEDTTYGKRVPSTSPTYQIGTYSRGMVQGSINKIDYHSAMAFDNRYSGCIYEAAGWNYDATSYNSIWRMSYGYNPNAAANFENTATGKDESNTTVIRPNWWHYFNSHVLNVGMFDQNFDSYSRHLLVMANPAYEGLGYLNWITTFAKYASDNDEAHANPATELDAEDLGHWLVFPPSNGAGNNKTGGATGAYNVDASGTDEDNYSEGRYRGMINHNTHDTVTDLYSGGYAFHLGMDCRTQSDGNPASTLYHMNPEINVTSRDTMTAIGTDKNGWDIGNIYDTYAHTSNDKSSEIGEWYSYLISKGDVDMTDVHLNSFVDKNITFYPWMSMAAVSSFPHNDLGQDFRFNIRILHRGGRGFPYYYGGNMAAPAIFTLEGNGATQVPGGITQTAAIGVDSDFPIHDAQIAYLAQDSYYWYKVNTVQIAFPSYVRCPRYYKNVAIDKTFTEDTTIDNNSNWSGSLERDEKLDDTFRCMDSGNFNGHRGWDSSRPYEHTKADAYTTTSAWTGDDNDKNHRPSENYPYYLEQLTENDGSAYEGILVSHSPAKQYDNVDGFICGPTPPFAGTSGEYKGDWFKCGQKYTVHGLMNTYDEHAQLEYGTMQEIWFQFWYHYVITFDTDNNQTVDFWDKRTSNTNRGPEITGQDWPETHSVTSPHILHDGSHDDVYFTMSNYKNAQTSPTTITYDHVHNFPNILFNAFELRGIRFFCDEVNSFNSNTCFHSGKAYGDPYDATNLIGDSMTNP